MIPIKFIALQKFEGRPVQVRGRNFQAQNWLKTRDMLSINSKEDEHSGIALTENNNLK